MKPTYDQLVEIVGSLQEENRELKGTVGEQNRIIEEQNKRITKLEKQEFIIITDGAFTFG